MLSLSSDIAREKYHLVRESFLTGVVVIIPAILTLYLLKLVIGFVVDIATPFARILVVLFPWIEISYAVLDLGIVAILVVLTFVVGYVAHFHTGERAITYVDSAVTRIPGIGTVYESFRRMGDAMIASDRGSFQEVKLVELPASETYTLGFLIAETPDELSSATDRDLQTVFVPLAPNPIMAGFLVHVPENRLIDVDFSVEAGISAIVSLGATETQSSAGIAARYASWEEEL